MSNKQRPPIASIELLDFAILYDKKGLGGNDAKRANTVAFVILLPLEPIKKSVAYLGIDVEGEEGVRLFNADYSEKDHLLYWQGENGKTVGLDLNGTELEKRRLVEFIPAFFIAQDIRTGSILDQGAIQVV